MALGLLARPRGDLAPSARTAYGSFPVLSARWRLIGKDSNGVEGGRRSAARGMSQKGGERAYRGHLGKDRSLGESLHSNCDREIRFTALMRRSPYAQRLTAPRPERDIGGHPRHHPRVNG
jgi:hypothetical protein